MVVELVCVGEFCISSIANLENVLSQFPKENVLIFAEKYENITLDNSLSDLNKNEPILVVVGPEGGFSCNEFDYFLKKNYKLISIY